jgi:hypothetical protein
LYVFISKVESFKGGGYCIMAKNKPHKHGSYVREVDSSTVHSNSSDLKPINYYLSEDYETYFIEYIGDINKSFENIDCSYK